MKRKLLAGLIAAVLVTVGVVGGVVLAQEADEESDGDDSSTFFERVATILGVDGVDADDLEEAFKQAKHDVETDRVGDYLDKLVEKEVIEQETADSYLEWYGDRPADILPFLRQFPFGGWKRGFGGWHSSSWPEIEELLEGKGLAIPKIRHSGKQFRFYFPKGGTAD